MFRLSKLSLALAAFALVASQADAQQWNRRISDIRIVHPPGTPPGTWRIEADVGVIVNPAAPIPSLGYDCTLFLNDVPIQVITTTVEPAAATNNCNALCNNACTFLLFDTLPVDGTCLGGTTFCGCLNVKIEVFTPTLGNTLDTVRVTITPSPGTVQELDTSDDSMTRVIGYHQVSTGTCASDVGPTSCPCVTSGAPGHGCGNSSNPSGAHLTATGFVETLPGGTDSVVLEINGMTSGAPLLYFQGTSVATVIPFGDGVLCTTGSLIRLRVKINVGGASRFPEPGEPSLSTTGGVSPGSGVTMYYQAYYRDSAPYCTSATFNLTNGISLTWY